MIFCKLPRAGLGNQLFLIAKSLILSKKNNSKIIFSNAQQIKIGPYVRGEKSKRNYSGFFKFQKGYIIELLLMIFYKRRISKIKIENPFITDKCPTDVKIVGIPHYSVYFDELIPFRESIIQLIFDSLTDKIQFQINNLANIDVAVHVRLGDFQKLIQGVDFKSVGSTRTPFSYYIDLINKLSSENPNYKFTVFSDGRKEELTPILSAELSNTQLYNSVNDLVDLYQMSKSKILITSAGSTYSYWAGFLGECEVIQHPDHFCRIK